MQEGGFSLKAPALKVPSVGSKLPGPLGDKAAAAAAGLKDKAAGAAGAAAAAAKKAAEEAARMAKEKAELEAGKAALRKAGLSEAQIAMAEKGTTFMGGVSKTKEALTRWAGQASLFFAALWAGMKANWLTITILLIVFTTLILAIVYVSKMKGSSTTTDMKAGALAVAGREGFQDSDAAVSAAEQVAGAVAEDSLGKPAKPPAPPPEEELTFGNAQAKTIKQAGYLGPPTGGKFDPEEATAQALKAGFRAFVLQIDSVKSGMDPNAFPEAGKPTLLYRNDEGTLISANAGSIEGVAKTLAALAFRPEVPDYTMPVILYLHVLKTPSPVRAPEEYTRFLSLIARALNPLAPFHLGSTPMGIFHRQKREKEILGLPLKALEGQVIILSNADTTIFRAPLAGGLKYAPADDLDYWVNMRVYLENEDEVHGIAKTFEVGDGASSSPAAVVTSLSSILRLGAAKRDAFAGRGKGRFVIAMPGAMANPTPKELDKATKELAVNLVPLDIFGVELEESKKLVELYEGKPYLSKPVALRSRAAAAGV